jgi:hypothetical protein
MRTADRYRAHFWRILNSEGGEPPSPGDETDDYADYLLSQRGTIVKRMWTWRIDGRIIQMARQGKRVHR